MRHPDRKSSYPVKYLPYLIVGFILLAGLFFIPVPQLFKTKLGATLLNSCHIVFFCAFALVFYPYLKGSHLKRIPVFLLVVLILSFVIENVQSTVHRAFQWEDILRNVIGAFTGIAVYLYLQKNAIERKYRMLLLTASFAMVFIERAPLFEKLISHFIKT